MDELSRRLERDGSPESLQERLRLEDRRGEFLAPILRAPAQFNLIKYTYLVSTLWHPAFRDWTPDPAWDWLQPIRMLLARTCIPPPVSLTFGAYSHSGPLPEPRPNVWIGTSVTVRRA